jgi:hypothetical protein
MSTSKTEYPKTSNINTVLFNFIGPTIALEAINTPDCSIILGEDSKSPFNSDQVNFDLSAMAKKLKFSPPTVISGYDLSSDTTEEEIVESSKRIGIYREFDLRHINEVCRRHFFDSENILSRKILSNLFFVRDLKGNLSILKVVCHDKMKYSILLPFTPKRKRFKEHRFFLGK